MSGDSWKNFLKRGRGAKSAKVAPRAGAGGKTPYDVHDAHPGLSGEGLKSEDGDYFSPEAKAGGIGESRRLGGADVALSNL